MNTTERLSKKTGLCLLAVMACLSFALPLLAIPQSQPTEATQTTETEHRDCRQEKVANLARPKILIPEGMQANDVIYTPFLFWRAWVHQKLPFGRVVWAMVLALTPLNFLFRKTLKASIENYRFKWLKCLGIGIGSVTAALIAEATIARLGLFTQLSVCILAIVEFLACLGLTVAAQSLGRSVWGALKLPEKPSNPVVRAIATLWIGVFLLSLLVLMPNISVLQELGNRMLALIALTGAGAVVLQIYSLSAGEEASN
jgi:hypothetical protein